LPVHGGGPDVSIVTRDPRPDIATIETRRSGFRHPAETLMGQFLLIATINRMETTMINSMKAAINGIKRRAQASRDHAYLMSADDHILRDIGVRRGDLRMHVYHGEQGV
jgi:hypothetical protein